MMDPFVRKLIERLHAEDQPLTRNRHFHTFETPEGKLALRISRRLKSVQKDLLASEDHAPPLLENTSGKDPGVKLTIVGRHSRRTCQLSQDEFELLLKLPEVERMLEKVKEIHRK